MHLYWLHAIVNKDIYLLSEHQEQFLISLNNLIWINLTGYKHARNTEARDEQRKAKNEIRENLLMNKSIHDTQWGASGKEKDFHRLYT